MKHLKRDDNGRGGDTLVAHINPREAALLKLLGGSGTINPKTGSLEFWDSDPMGGSADYGGDRTGTTSDMGRDYADPMGSQYDYAPAGPAQALTAPDYSEQAQAAQYSPRSMPQRAMDWARAQPREFMQNIRDNPIASGLNFAASFTPFGGINTLSGLFGGPTFGGMATAAGRAATGYGGAPAGTQTAQAGRGYGQQGGGNDMMVQALLQGTNAR